MINILKKIRDMSAILTILKNISNIKKKEISNNLKL